MSGRDERRALEALARAYGVDTSYLDGFKRKRTPPPESVVAVLRALGAELDSPAGALHALRAREAFLAQRFCDPVAVAWDGKGARVRIDRSRAADTVRCDVALEEGGTTSSELRVDRDPQGASVTLPKLPLGVHRCELGAGRTTIVAAPAAAPMPAGRSWGVFAPAYAFVSGRSWGTGDLTDLRTIAQWIASLGGSHVGTLPMLATFLDDPYEPSPYSPVSRLFWNEIFVDVDALPESRDPRAAAAVERARGAARSKDFERTIDYRSVARAKRGALEACAAAVSPARAGALRRHVASHPELRAYARFRSEVERRGRWREWPSSALAGMSDDDERARYHEYVQWVASEQLAGVREAGAGLYLDLPLGVHPEGYDTWRFPDSFAGGVSAGAPPDAFFVHGQVWGSPPLHPERIRDGGYAYPRAVLRALMQPASNVRIDHVMGLHRLFWVPDGAEASDGTYVRYPAEELYALLTLEAHRSHATVVGEDLGTVPGGVRPAMRRHGILRSYVVQEELRPDVDRPLRPPPTTSVATLNTHDMPTFASFWAGSDIDERERAGWLRPDDAEAETKRRAAKRDALIVHLRESGALAAADEPTGDAVLRATLTSLGSSNATIVLVALEDLWSETEPQNRPGTGPSAGNWARKARRSIEEILSDPEIAGTLQALDTARRSAGRRLR